MKEILLGVEPVMQPKPNRNGGGDCFACALTAAMRHLFPERPPSFDDVWGWFESEYATGGKCLDNTWTGMERAMCRSGYPLDITADVVQHNPSPREWSGDWHMPMVEGAWSRRLEAWLRAGYVALCNIALHGEGPLDQEYRRCVTDHFVVVDGVRPTPGSDFDHRDIHVVCSVKGAYWIKEYLLLRQHGAAAWWLVRRKDP